MAGGQTPEDDKAHDVLAAEAFAVPAPDPSLHHGPLVLPDDPTGIEGPHDVLAAEEFPMPAVEPHPSADALAVRRRTRFRLAAAAALLALVAVKLLRRR